MSDSSKKSLKEILVFKGLKWSVVSYVCGMIVLVCVLYVQLSGDFGRISNAILYQTSLAILADLQDGNYYGAKRSLDQAVKTENFKGLVVMNSRGEVFAQSGTWGSPTLKMISSLQLPTSGESKTIKVGWNKVLVRGVWDQNGIVWGRLAAVVNDSAFLSVIIGVTFWLVLIMTLVVGAYVIINAVIIRGAIKPLISLAAEINAIATRIDELDPSRKGRDSKVGDVGALITPLNAYGSAGNEVDNLLHSFIKLISKAVQFFDASLKSALLAEKMSQQLAHDIRSPLSVLKGYVQAPRDDDAAMDDEEREYVGAARRSVEKLENMAEDLLDYARAHKIERTRTRLADIVRETLREVSAEAEQHRVAVACRDEAGIVAMVDREKMGRVLTNIVLNAVQAHERPGSVSVQVSASDRDLAIAVVDDGKGIHPENMSRIFESSFTFGKPRGTGLGLAYCKRVIEAHGGELSVESEPGKGSTFTIRIPGCVMTAAEAQGEEADVCANRLEIGPEAGACNVMVVDDDADVLRQWRRIIDEKGGRLVYSAASVEEVLGAEALDFAAVDAAIVDYQYEGSPRNGIELIRLLKGKGVRQVHLCTGFHGDESIRREAMDAGADSVIPKPIATF